MTMLFRKTPKTFKEMRQIASRPTLVEETMTKMTWITTASATSNALTDKDTRKKKFPFMKSHPGRNFCHLARLKRWVVPKVFVPKGRLCKIEELKIEAGKNVDEETKHLREVYAKIALLIFYPHRKLNDLKKRGSYWSMFWYNLKRYRKR